MRRAYTHARETARDRDAVVQGQDGLFPLHNFSVVFCYLCLAMESTYHTHFAICCLALFVLQIVELAMRHSACLALVLLGFGTCVLQYEVGIATIVTSRLACRTSHPHLEL